mgnify:FL=1|tara:strand:+ start:9595 stop:10470 length:876 start_codon:yes stop_codon:yes gene_type:complete
MQPQSFEAGWFKDIPNEVYHRSNGTSSSQIKKMIEKTGAHLQHDRKHPKPPTPAMALGTAVHSLVLEPDMFDTDIVVAPDFNKRTKDGRADFELFQEENKNRTIISPEQNLKAKAMAARVHEHPIASILVQDLIVESSVFQWYKSYDPDDQTEYKTMLKVRPDGISKNMPILIDLKSTADGSYSGFIKSIQNFYYHLSAAMYLELCNQCQPLLDEVKHFAFTKFVFVCVENFAPYEVSVYEMSQEYREIGALLFRQGIYNLHKSKLNNWDGYPEEVRVIEPPSWATRGFIV